MNKNEERLDAEFDHYLVDMKPYVLKLPQKLERQRCSLWIKKLCDPSGVETGIIGRKNRNLYAKLLLQMLKRGLLEGPFTQRPEEGVLKPLPTYMSIYFDEPNSSRFHSMGSDGSIDWLGELESKDKTFEESWRLTGKDEIYTYSRKLNSRSLSPNQRLDEENLAVLQSGSPIKKPSVSFDDSDLEARLNSWNLGIEKPRYLREKPVVLSPLSPKSGLGRSTANRDEQSSCNLLKSEFDTKIKVMEAKFHEEKMRLQQKHDADVQKILDRKNGEIEELKTVYKSKNNEYKETIYKLEKKVQMLVRESQVIREHKEIQISELKKMCEKSTDTLKNEWEKKLQIVMADMEQEKFDLQRNHTENIQELVDGTNTRLRKMESDYMAQTKATTQTVKELEARVQQLTIEVESSNSQWQRISKDKAEIEKSHQTVCNELQDVEARLSMLQKEKNRICQDYEKQIQQLQSKFDSEMSYITQQNALSAAKASNVIEDLEQRASQLKQQIQECEHQRQQQLRDQENTFQKEKLHLERLNEQQVHDLHQRLGDEKDSAERKICKLEGLLKEREEQLRNVTEMHRVQAQQADAALEAFKQQVESNTEKVYSDMRQQMEKVEADLIRSKSLREKQNKESSRQLEELKQRYEQQIVDLRLKHEEEKTYLFQQHNTEKDRIIKDHEQEMDRMEKQLRKTMSDDVTKNQQWRQRDSQTISDLEAQVYKLKEELIQVNSQRKQQLVELGLLRDEEKQKMTQEHQRAMSKLRAEMETMKMDLQKTHATQTEDALEKANSRLKQIEKEYSNKLAKSAQVISELQTSITAMREQSCVQQLKMERRLQEGYETEKRQLINNNERVVKVLKEEVDGYHNRLQSTEKRFQEKELSTQEQVTHIRQEYELKMKSLMPAAMRQELEDTIASLKSQVNFLELRVQGLQEDPNTKQNKR
ncbi:centrosomal protein of 112 kDa [Pelodytes ibericus]